jgi:hypothetical protein
MVDVLYAVQDCNRIDSTAYMENLVTDQSVNAFVVNGLTREYAVTDTPCPMKFNTECLVVEYDFTRRYVHPSAALKALEPGFFELPEDYQKRFKGFSFEYASSYTEVASPTQWTTGGYGEICKPDFASVKPPKPQIVFKEKCCSAEEGNGIFQGNFWADASITLSNNLVNDEDYRIIYRIEPYSPAGPTYLDREFKCEAAYFADVESWYPTEPSDDQKEEFLKQKWAGTKSGVYPTRLSSTSSQPVQGPNGTNATSQNTLATGQTTATTSTQAKVFKAKLWYPRKKAVRIFGKLSVVDSSQILLNAPIPSADRRETVPTMYGHAMISAVTCKANKVGDTVVWIKSEVEVKNEMFTTGPSLGVFLGNLSVPGSLLSFDQTGNTTRQLALAEPLIATVRSQLAALAGLSDRVYGMLRQIEAVGITVERSRTNRRLNQKTADIFKPGYTPPPAKFQEPANGTVDSAIYTVSLNMSILCKSVQDMTRIATGLTQPGARRQFTVPINSIVVKPNLPSASFSPSQIGGPCLSHYDCVAPGLFCSSQKKCQPCSRCSIDSQDSVDGICPRILCPLAGGFPQCVDPDKLVSAVQSCKSSYDFEVWTYNQNKIQPKVQLGQRVGQTYAFVHSANDPCVPCMSALYICALVLHAQCMQQTQSDGNIFIDADSIMIPKKHYLVKISKTVLPVAHALAETLSHNNFKTRVRHPR